MDAETRHYELEKNLAKEIRQAPADCRFDVYRKVYAELYEQLVILGLEHHLAQNSAEQVRLCLELVRPLVGSSSVFVEYGAGDGQFASAVKNSLAVETVLATDISTSQNIYDQHFDNTAAWPVLTPDQLVEELAGKKIDFAFSCHFIEHLHPEDLREHLKSVRRHLNGDGRYLMITPNRLLGPHDVSMGRDSIASGLHLREYSHSQLMNLAIDCGYSDAAALCSFGGGWRSIKCSVFRGLDPVLESLGYSMRSWLLELFGQARPFRALEQVIVVASR